MKQQRKISVHAYKWNGWLYRTWEFPKILKETDEFICVSTQNCKVITSEDNSDRFFHSRNTRPTVWYFFKKEWWNLIISEKNGKYFYYINIASPYLFDDDVIKYIDFDLDYYKGDLSKNQFKELDSKEYQENAARFGYPPELMKKIDEAKQQVIENLKNHNYDQFFQKSPLTRKKGNKEWTLKNTSTK